MICSRSPPRTLTKRQHCAQKQPGGSAPPPPRLGQAATTLGTGKRELGRGRPELGITSSAAGGAGHCVLRRSQRRRTTTAAWPCCAGWGCRAQPRIWAVQHEHSLPPGTSPEIIREEVLWSPLHFRRRGCGPESGREEIEHSLGCPGETPGGRGAAASRHRAPRGGKEADCTTRNTI